MSGNTPTAPSPPSSKPSTSDDIIELLPPPELGFGGTAKFDINDPASMAIATELSSAAAIRSW